nr:MAG TPA: ATP dependent helicase [Caudoviricetes sp.]
MYTENMKEVNYHSKIVGTTFENRQDILAHLEGNESLRVRREPENQYDPRAVAVDVDIKGKWYPVGYIAKDKNKDIAESLDAGREVEIKISEITGGDKGKNLGMNICLKYEKEVSEPISDATNDPTASQAPQSVNLKNPTVYKSKVLGREITVGVDNGHIYLPHYMSGSRFPRKFFKQFTDEDKERVLDYYEREKDVKREEVEKTWEMKADIATGYGTAIHAAVELYYNHHKVGDKIKGKDGVNKAYSKNPFFAHIVKSLVEDLGPGRFLAEEFIWHEGLRFCGAIDILEVVDKNTVIIHDEKTNDSVLKKVYQEKDSPFKKDVDNTQLGEYWLQLSFYAYILKQYGINVKELQIHHLDPERLVQGKRPWVHYKHDVVDISKALKEV